MELKNSFHIKDIVYDVHAKKLKFQFADGVTRIGIGITTVEDIVEEIEKVIISLQD